jgi:hypothetical protein
VNRYLLHAAGVLSLLACLLTIALWAHSRFGAIIVIWAHPNSPPAAPYPCPRDVFFAGAHCAYQSGSGTDSTPGWPLDWDYIAYRFSVVSPDPGDPWWQRLGFTAVWDGSRYRYVTWPYWFPALLTLGPTAWWMVYLARERSRSFGTHCPACGYSLHGTPSGLCPECGAAREAKA